MINASTATGESSCMMMGLMSISALRDYSMYIGLQQLKEHFAKMGFQETIKEVFRQWE